MFQVRRLFERDLPLRGANMAIYNIGSINIDHLYHVEHFVRPGETLASTQYQQWLGGKGANQSVALAKAGAKVHHIGAIHQSDARLLLQLESLGVETNQVARLDVATGHAIIQLNQQAENAIILFAGANHALSQSHIDATLNSMTSDDWLLLQNETNLVQYSVERASQLGLKVAFNPAPMNAQLTRQLLPHLSLLVVNEIEAIDLAQTQTLEQAQTWLQAANPNLAVLLTLGAQGVRYLSQGVVQSVPAFRVEAQDTTAAGDTFIGYFLAAITQNFPLASALTRACAASAICVTRIGAATSIPLASEVDAFLLHNA
jgi:ribokinase